MWVPREVGIQETLWRTPYSSVGGLGGLYVDPRDIVHFLLYWTYPLGWCVNFLCL